MNLKVVIAAEEVAPAAAADFSVMTRTARILKMESHMTMSTIGILGVLVGFGLVLSKLYLLNSFAYGITFVLMSASTMLASHFQILAATLQAAEGAKAKKKAASTVASPSTPVRTTGKAAVTDTTVTETGKDTSHMMSPELLIKR